MAKPNRIGKGFNALAPIYDSIVKLIFGNSINSLQTQILKGFDSKDSCLIIGGGSGKILAQAIEANLAKNYFYAELSSAMIEKTKAKTFPETIDISYSDNWKDWGGNSFDYVILPFVLDCYTEIEISTWLQELKDSLMLNARIIFIDFNNEPAFAYQPSLWKSTFIKMLYVFFGLTTAIKAKYLAPFNKLFERQNFQTEKRKHIYNGWVQAVVWKMDDNTQPKE